MSSNRKSCLRFAKDTRGSIAPMFALLAIPLLAFAGGAIDFATAISMRTKMQQALDAATIAAMNDYRNNGNANKAEILLKKLLASELAPQGLSPQDANAKQPRNNEFVLTGAQIDVASGSLEPSLSARIPTSILKIIQIDNIDVSVTSGTSLSGRKIDVGIMLDVTGSMCDGGQSSCSSGHKLDALKRAVKHFLGIVLATGDGSSMAAIIPFSSAVNVGDYVKAATGETNARRTETVRCNGHHGGGHHGGGDGGSECTKTYYLTQCVTERSGTGRRNNNLPGDDKYFTPVWSERSSSDCTPGNANKIQPLTSDLETLEDRVDALTADGGTAGHLGAQWTWAAISHTWGGFWGSEHAPRAPGGDIKKVAILMTDGDMTLHNIAGGPTCQGYPVHGRDCVESREDFLAICEDMKAEGITVYTIGYAPGGQGISSIGKKMLQDCASPDKAFLPYSEEAMERDFQNIGKDVAGGILITQ